MISEDRVGKWYRFKAKGPTTVELLLYDEIGESFFGGGVSAKQFAEDLKAVRDAATLNLRINSPGGSVFDGFAIYNQLARFPGQIVVDIDGLAASIASVIALVGKPTRMAQNALYMVHDPSGLVVGTAQDMRAMADTLDKVRDNIVGAYYDKTALSPQTLSQLMTNETWMTADEAKDQGFIDEITGEITITNSFDLSKFKHPPARPVPVAAMAAGLDQRRVLLARMAQRALRR